MCFRGVARSKGPATTRARPAMGRRARPAVHAPAADRDGLAATALPRDRCRGTACTSHPGVDVPRACDASGLRLLRRAGTEQPAQTIGGVRGSTLFTRPIIHRRRVRATAPGVFTSSSTFAGRARGIPPSIRRAYVPSDFIERKFVSTSVSSTIWHIVRSTPHRRCTCSALNRRPGISRYSARIRSSSCKFGDVITATSDDARDCASGRFGESGRGPSSRPGGRAESGKQREHHISIHDAFPRTTRTR